MPTGPTLPSAIPWQRVSPCTIVIVSWNSRELLEACLSSLQDLEGKPTGVLVVDNASTDGSAAMVASRFKWVMLLAERENLGFAGGVNAAARRVPGSDLLLLNPDVRATPAGVASLIASLDTYPKAGAVAGHLHDEHGRTQRGFNVRRFPTLASFAADLLLVDQVWPANPASARYLAADTDYSQPTEVDQPAAACLLLRRRAFDEIGGLDEGFYPAWFEDVDLCKRLKARGWSIMLLPGATFVHQGGVAMRTLGMHAFSRVWYRNLHRYVAKHHGGAAAGLIRLLIAAGMFLRILVASARGDRPASDAYRMVLFDAVRGWSAREPERPAGADGPTAAGRAGSTSP